MKNQFIITSLLLSITTLVYSRPDFSGHPGFQAQPTSPDGRVFQYTLPQNSFRNLQSESIINTFDYQATLAENAHSADSEQTIESIRCSSDSIQIELSSSDSPVKQWSVPFILNIGKEWNCRLTSDNSKVAQAIVRKVNAVEWINNVTANLISESSSFAEAFESASVRVSTSQPQAKRVQLFEDQIDKKTKSDQIDKETRSKPKLNHGKLDFIEEKREPSNGKMQGRTSAVQYSSPSKGQSFFSGDTITIRWAYPSGGPLSGDTIKVGIKLDGNWVSASWVTGLSMTVTVSVGTLSSAEYYASLEWTVYDCYYDCIYTYDSPDYFSINYIPPIAIVSPTISTAVQAGQAITVQWAQNLAPQTLYIYLMYYNTLLPNSVIGSYTYSASTYGSTQHTFSMGTLSSYESYDKYYIEIDYDCGVIFCSSSLSNYFSIFSTAQTTALQITSPDSSSNFRVGNIIDIQWTSSGLSSSDTVSLYVMESSWGWDSTVITAPSNPLVSDGNYDLTIPYSVSDSSMYYIEAEYNCGTFFCDHSYSQIFSIISNPLFTFNSPTPSYGEELQPGQPITVSWTSASSVLSTDDIYVALYIKYPSFIPDMLFNSDSSTQTTNGAQSWTYTPNEGTVFPVYFAILSDCLLLDYFCTTTRSPVFMIPSSSNKDWEYTEPLFYASCDNCTDQSVSTLCNICKKGVSMDVSLTCTNCSLESTITMTDFTFEIENFEISGFTFLGNGVEDLLIQLDAQANIEYQNIWKKTLFSWPFLGISFYIASFQFNFGITLAVDLEMGLDVGGSIDAQVSTYSKATWSAYIQYGTRYVTEFSVNASLIPLQSPEYTIQASAHANASIAIIPTISFSVPDILLLDFKLVPKLDAGALFQYPSFDAKSNPLVPYTTFPFGDCSHPHYVEYAVQFTLTGFSELDLPFANYQFSDTYQFLNYMLMSGCLISSGNSSWAHSLNLYLSSTLDSLGLTADELLSGMLAQLGNVDSYFDGRLIIDPPTESNGENVMTVHFIPDKSGTEDYELLVNYLGSHIEMPTSQFYTSNLFGQNLQGKLSMYPASTSSHSIPVTSASHSIPVTSASHSIPVTSASHSIPVTSASHSIHVTSSNSVPADSSVSHHNSNSHGSNSAAQSNSHHSNSQIVSSAAMNIISFVYSFAIAIAVLAFF